jgi:hypothetical protein
MKKSLMVLAVAAIVAATAAGEAMAGNGRGAGYGVGAATATATRPVDSQRRDGTFAVTGTTANGSATRPNGLASGDCLLDAIVADPTSVE